MRYKKIFFLILFTFILLLSADLVFAADTPTCATKYPDDGKCAAGTTCSEGSADTAAGLCEANQICCHKNAETTKSPALTEINLQIPILELKSVKNIADYIGYVYNASLILILPFVIIVIIYGGIEWLGAAGRDAEGINKAKKRIFHGIIGLSIILLSYLLLDLVGITKLSAPDVSYILPEDINDYYFVGTDSYPINSGSSGGTAPDGVSPCGVPIYRQGGKAPWRREIYGKGKKGCGTYGGGGCGATSFAMVLTYYGKNLNPLQAGDDILVPCGCRPCGDGTNRYCFDSNKKPCALNKVGFKGIQIPENKVIQYVQKGKPIIASVGNCKFTANRHFIVLGCWQNNKFYVNDPNAAHPSPWISTKEEVFNCNAPAYFYIAPSNKFQPE